VATRLHISKSICVLGAVEHDRVLDFMLDCDVYVLPSVDEPFPIALLEALAAGVPSVCTTGCGLANELRRYGAAIVADPAPQSLASAIAEALAPDRTEVLSRRSRETVQRHFSTGALLAHLVDIYSRARLAQV
jgi:glycosyltransferase involved in cell wall biosynthesis